MKFIRTVDGGWLSVEHIAVFRPNTLSEPVAGQPRVPIDFQALGPTGTVLGAVATAVLDELLAEAEPSRARRQR